MAITVAFTDRHADLCRLPPSVLAFSVVRRREDQRPGTRTPLALPGTGPAEGDGVQGQCAWNRDERRELCPAGIATWMPC